MIFKLASFPKRKFVSLPFLRAYLVSHFYERYVRYLEYEALPAMHRTCAKSREGR